MQKQTVIEYLEQLDQYHQLNDREKIFYYRLIQLIHTKKVNISNSNLFKKLSYDESKISIHMVAKLIPRLNKLGLLHTENSHDAKKIAKGYKHARIRHMTIPQDILGVLRFDKTFRTLESIQKELFNDLLDWN